MLQKIKLNLTEKYQQAIAGYHLADMVVKFAQGQEHVLNIGTEQGGIQKWDDLVLMVKPTHYKHIQIKSQFTDFPEDPTVRDNYQSGKRSGSPRDLNKFDETLESLANWNTTIDPSTISPKHSFEFSIPVITLRIKQGLTAKNLNDLIAVHIKPHTTAADLVTLQSAEPLVQRCFEYLTTWCSFTGWDHILKVFRLLQFAQRGTENDLHSNTEQILSNVFTNPADARAKIIQYLLDNTTFVGAISPRPLLYLLKDQLLPTVQLWTQIEKVGSQWEISGIQDLSDPQEIERPNIVVPALWNNDRYRNLKILIPPDESCVLLNNVIHLALHLKGQVNTHASNKDLWSKTISEKVGGTIGTSANDCNDISITENTSPFTSSNSKILDTPADRDTFANKINSEIINSTWQMMVAELEKKLTSETQTELRDAVYARWVVWKKSLNADENQRKLLLQGLVHPQAEGSDIMGELRIGPKSVHIIVEGLYLLLVISVALSTNENTWNQLTPELNAKLIGIEYWSGVSGKPRKVKSLDADKDILELIGKESSKVLVLSGVRSNKEDIYDYSLADGKEKFPHLGTPYRPKLLLTFNPKIRKLINEGKTAPITSFLKEMLKEDTDAKSKAADFKL